MIFYSDDVCRIWSNDQGHPTIFAMGNLCVVLALRTRRLCRCIFLSAREVGMRSDVLSLQVLQRDFAIFKRELISLLHNSYPDKFLKDIDIAADRFVEDIVILLITLLGLRVLCYYLLKWRIIFSR